MSDALEPARTVLVGSDATVREGFTTAIQGAAVDGHTGLTVERAEDPETTANRLGEEADVATLVVDGSTVGDPLEWCERARAADPDLPILLLSGDSAVAREATTVGDVRWLDVDVDPSTLGAAVAEGVSTYDRRSGMRDDATMLRSFLRNVGFSMYVKDDEARHVRMASVPGTMSPQEVLGKRDTEIYGNDTVVQEGVEDDLRIIEEGTAIYGREEEVETDAGPRWFRTSKAPWHGEQGQIRGLVGLTWDVTDEMLMERQLSLQEDSFEQFTRSLSHDIRTPLQVARGNLELARGGDTDAIETAEAALDRIVEMIEDLETVAREQRESSLYSNRDDATSRPLPPATDLGAVARRIWSVMETEDASLTIDLPDGAVINVEDASIRPILENLFTNAIRHAGEGVAVTLGALPTGGFYVEDDGPGISPEERERVLRAGYTTAQDGTGEGLTLVQGIAERHDWEIEITESEDGGARIEVHNCLLVAAPPTSPPIAETVTLTDNDDVGDVDVPGEASFDGRNNEWIVEGAGKNVWGQDNELHFVYVPLEGPARIQARVRSIDERSQYTKAGVMVRSDLSEAAAYGAIGATPVRGTEVLWRSAPGHDGVSQQLDDEPLANPWYRLDRVGDTLTTFLSADGEDWRAIDQRQVSLDDRAMVGLMVCSHMSEATAVGRFTDVTAGRLDVD